MENDNELFTVYKISCLKNGKVYVGTTSGTAEWRFSWHWYDRLNAKMKHRPLYQDMLAFGRNAFVADVIESGVSQEEASSREDYWIEKLRSDGYDLYNRRGGGGCIQLTDEQEEKIIKLYKEGLNTPEIAEIVGRGTMTIWNVLNRNGIKMRDGGFPKRKVLCIETGIAYESVCDAARQLGLDPGNISKCCRGEYNSTGRKHFCFEEERGGYVIQERKVDTTPKKVVCVENGKVYPSASEAARELGLNPSSISRCCNGKLKSTGGMHFCFLGEDEGNFVIQKIE